MSPRIALLALLAVLAAGRASAEEQVAVAVDDAGFLTFPGSGFRVNLRPLIAAEDVETARILFSETRGEISWVVVHVSGPSRAGGGTGYCGAGTEENLLWVKTSHASILDVRSVRVGSCVFSIDSTRPLAVTKKGLRLEYASVSEGRKFVCTYDARAPERGLTVTSTEGE